MQRMNEIFGNSILMSEKSLDFLWKKQQVTMNNIANSETPDYKAQYVSFEETFQNNLKNASLSGNSQTVRDAIQDSNYTVHTSLESARLDGNSVNTDTESVELTRTALQYQYVLNSLNSDISRLRLVIRGQ